jgi:hypothetical protein
MKIRRDWNCQPSANDDDNLLGQNVNTCTIKKNKEQQLNASEKIDLEVNS